MNQGTGPKLLNSLSRANSLQLLQLQTIIVRMIADPKRIIAVRVNMHLTQTHYLSEPSSAAARKWRLRTAT